MTSLVAAPGETGLPSAAASPAGERLCLSLPATSANLGPGFDTLALALTLSLKIEAVRASEFRITATGRNTDICSELRRNLLLDVYQKTLASNSVDPPPLALAIHNEIPIGMGCGSSAAVRLAAISLANHFGQLGWDGVAILNEASRLEGHPDNAAACWLGGLTVAASDGGCIRAVKILPAMPWRVVLVLPDQPLATVAARSVLPQSYSREDVVFNLQRASLLPAAFAGGRGDLLRAAMQDRMHQPFRGELCPLLPRLLPLAGELGILGVALSGAGPAVILLIENAWPMKAVEERVKAAIGDCPQPELIECGIEVSAAQIQVKARSD